MNIAAAREGHARWRRRDNLVTFLDVPALAAIMLGFGRGTAIMPAWLAATTGTVAAAALLLNGLLVKLFVRRRREEALLRVLMADQAGTYGPGTAPVEDEP